MEIEKYSQRGLPRVFLEFPDFPGNSVVREPKFILQTAGLQHRITAAPKLGYKGLFYKIKTRNFSLSGSCT